MLPSVEATTCQPVPGGTAWRFTVYHVMEVAALAPLFPVRIEDIA